MRICLSVFLVFMLAHSFANSMQDSLYLSLKGKNLTIAEIFKTLRQQTGLVVFYNNDLLNDQERMDIDLEYAEVKELMDYITKGKELTYQIKDRFILLQKKAATKNASNSADRSGQSKTIEALVNFIVTGVVRNENGEALAGVSVRLKGTQLGATTGSNGAYALNLPDGSGTLVFSYVGYVVKELPVNARTKIDIVLSASDASLDQVVVIGYGAQAKKDLTGAVGSIGAAEIQDKAILNFTEAMAGQIAGVQVQQTSTAPGAGMNIKIRGTGSLGNAGNNNMPLYVVDGVPLDNDVSSRSAMGAASSSPDVPDNPLAALNPADIESINILKDASATSIYGARGSNGVVLITTKMGQRGKTVIMASVSAGMQQVAHQIPMLNTAGYVERQIAIRNYGHVYLNGVRRPGRDESDPNSERALGNKIPNEYKNPSLLHDINWQDEVYRNAPMTNYQLSASGGTGNMRFYISGNYINQEALNINKGYKKYSLRGNIDADITNKIKVGFRIAPSYSINDIGASGGLTYYGGLNVAIVTMPPIYPAYNPDGTFATRADMPLTYDDGTAPTILNFTNPAAMSALYKSQMKRFNTLGTF
ncbi:MAG: SusC/RagA family TonB-linked outer membrane protein, partial [Chitinophagaceae bacterium]|nr:SusC/RagA family TonB-linked outer membrane protein [Chitinophagaceae bacterium]